MSSILDQIVAAKRTEVAARQAQVPLADVESSAATAPPVRGFAAGLTRVATAGPAVIAEIKRGSPSLGCIRPALRADTQAAAYERGGAAALSVLTDREFFWGGDEDFIQARAACTLPMLRKEFIIEPYQIYESRALGADCVLLILAILDDALARDLAQLAHELGMDVLAETHTADEIARAVARVPHDLVGINNRNLQTFDTSTRTSIDLARLVPDRECLVAESGLQTAADITALWQTGMRRFLVGEAFVRAADPTAMVRSFVTL